MLAHTSHQLSATVVDAPHPAALSHLGVLTVLSSTPPRPSDRKLHWAQHFDTLATKTGEKYGLVNSGRRSRSSGSSSSLGVPRSPRSPLLGLSTQIGGFVERDYNADEDEFTIEIR